MTTDPGPDPGKPEDKCPKCGSPMGKEHARNCGLWSPYSTSKWVKPEEKAKDG